MKTTTIILIVLSTALLLISCAPAQPTRTVTRVDAGTQIDLSGFWNDTDVRLVCEALINNFLASERIIEAIQTMGRRPVVIVGNFRNESDEHINTAIISQIMEDVILNTGRLDFVAGGALRDELRRERQDQQSQASEETASRLAQEHGADFMMTGSVRTMQDRAGNERVRSYFVRAEITDIESNRRIWTHTNSEIKKVIGQSSTRR